MIKNTPEHTPLELTREQATSILVVNKTYQQYLESLPLSTADSLTEIEWESLINQLLIRESMELLLDEFKDSTEQGKEFIKTLLPNRINKNHWELI